MEFYCLAWLFSFFSPAMLFSSIFRINDEPVTARVNSSQPMTSFNTLYLQARGLSEGGTVTVSTGFGGAVFSCCLSVRAEDLDVDVVLGSDWFRLYSASTWASARPSDVHHAPVDRPVTTWRPGSLLCFSVTFARL